MKVHNVVQHGRGGPSHSHRGSTHQFSGRSVQWFQRYACGQTDTQTDKHTGWSQYSASLPRRSNKLSHQFFTGPELSWCRSVSVFGTGAEVSRDTSAPDRQRCRTVLVPKCPVLIYPIQRHIRIYVRRIRNELGVNLSSTNYIPHQSIWNQVRTLTVQHKGIQPNLLYKCNLTFRVRTIPSSAPNTQYFGV